MDPLLEIHTSFLLKQVGRFVFSSTAASLSKFSNIRGCVLLDLDKPVPSEIEIDVAGEGTVHMEGAYRSLCFTCSFYSEYGHPEKLYIRRGRERERTQMQRELERVKRIADRAPDEQGFRTVVHKSSPRVRVLLWALWRVARWVLVARRPTLGPCTKILRR